MGDASSHVAFVVSPSYGIIARTDTMLFLLTYFTRKYQYTKDSVRHTFTIQKKINRSDHLFVSTLFLQQKKRRQDNDEVFSRLCILIFDILFIINCCTGEWLSKTRKKNDNKNEEGRRMDKENVENTSTNRRLIITISVDNNRRDIFHEIR